MLNKEQFKQWAMSRGYEENRFGHMVKTIADKNGQLKECRFKINAYSVRKEIACNHEHAEKWQPKKSWVRLKTAYFKNMTITQDNKITGFAY